MSSFSRLKNRLIARLITRFPELAKGFIDSYRPWESEGAIPWNRPTKALHNCRLALVTTAGVHHAGQPPSTCRTVMATPAFGNWMAPP